MLRLFANCVATQNFDARAQRLAVNSTAFRRDWGTLGAFP
jgi:hypothetical protein